LEGFPFIQEPPSGDLQERVLIRHHDYDQCFQSVQLLQWNSQVKFNVTVYRNLPTTRDSIMTRQFLTESLVDGERSQSKSFSSCARIGRIFSFSASSPLRFNSDRKSVV